MRDASASRREAIRLLIDVEEEKNREKTIWAETRYEVTARFRFEKKNEARGGAEVEVHVYHFIILAGIARLA